FKRNRPIVPGAVKGLAFDRNISYLCFCFRVFDHHSEDVVAGDRGLGSIETANLILLSPSILLSIISLGQHSSL
ncbi:MAG TPA: hypothetical protein VIJ93_12875, partial [bacterium]